MNLSFPKHGFNISACFLNIRSIYYWDLLMLLFYLLLRTFAEFAILEISHSFYLFLSNTSIDPCYSFPGLYTQSGRNIDSVSLRWVIRILNLEHFVGGSKNSYVLYIRLFFHLLKCFACTYLKWKRTKNKDKTK